MNINGYPNEQRISKFSSIMYRNENSILKLLMFVLIKKMKCGKQSL